MATRVFFIWLGVALLFGGLLTGAEYARNRLDDPDPARQRSGYLLPSKTYPAPKIIPGFPRPGHRLVVLFHRSVDRQMLFHDLAMQSDLDVMADVIFISQDGSRPVITNGVDLLLGDAKGKIVKAYGLNTPLDGGYPVGYVIVDSDGFIRYRTLDPHCMVVMGMNQEIKMMVRAIP